MVGMRRKKCVIPTCTISERKAFFTKNGFLSGHRFPRRLLSCKKHQWINIIRESMQDPTWTPTEDSEICSRHFRPELYYRSSVCNNRRYLSHIAVPSLNLTPHVDSSIFQASNSSTPQISTPATSSTLEPNLIIPVSPSANPKKDNMEIDIPSTEGLRDLEEPKKWRDELDESSDLKDIAMEVDDDKGEEISYPLIVQGPDTDDDRLVDSGNPLGEEVPLHDPLALTEVDTSVHSSNNASPSRNQVLGGIWKAGITVLSCSKCEAKIRLNMLWKNPLEDPKKMNYHCSKCSVFTKLTSDKQVNVAKKNDNVGGLVSYPLIVQGPNTNNDMRLQSGNKEMQDMAKTLQLAQKDLVAVRPNLPLPANHSYSLGTSISNPVQSNQFRRSFSLPRILRRKMPTSPTVECTSRSTQPDSSPPRPSLKKLAPCPAQRQSASLPPPPPVESEPCLNSLESAPRINCIATFCKERFFEISTNFFQHLTTHYSIVSIDNSKKKNRTTFRCRFCPSVSERAYRLRVHELEKHKERLTHPCHICSHQYSSEELLNSHLMIHLPKGPFKCLICKGFFESYDKFEEHLFSHLPLPLPLPLPNKPKSTPKNCRSVATQVGIFTGTGLERTFEDEDVGVIFDTEAEPCLPEATDVCIETNNSDLPPSTAKKNAHLFCNICGKASLNPADHVKHGLLHKKSTPKNFKCELCNTRKFRNGNSLISHILSMHENQEDEENQATRPFSCPKCPKRFITRFMFQRHTNFHNLDATKHLSCHVCDFRFYKNEAKQLDRHLKTRHAAIISWYLRERI